MTKFLVKYKAVTLLIASFLLPTVGTLAQAPCVVVDNAACVAPVMEVPQKDFYNLLGFTTQGDMYLRGSNAFQPSEFFWSSSVGESFSKVSLSTDFDFAVSEVTADGLSVILSREYHWSSYKIVGGKVVLAIVPGDQILIQMLQGGTRLMTVQSAGLFGSSPLGNLVYLDLNGYRGLFLRDNEGQWSQLLDLGVSTIQLKGIQYNKGNIYFVESRVSAGDILVAFNPETKVKTDIHRLSTGISLPGNPIEGQPVQLYEFLQDFESERLFLLAMYSDGSQGSGLNRSYAAELVDGQFKVVLDAPTQLGGQTIYPRVTSLNSNTGLVVADIAGANPARRAAFIWNGDSLQLLSDGTGGTIPAVSATWGCSNFSIENNLLQEEKIPCIQDGPTETDAESEIVLTGQNFQIPGFVRTDVLEDGVPISAERVIAVSDTEARFLAPSYGCEECEYEVETIYATGGILTSAPRIVAVDGPSEPPPPLTPRINTVTSATYGDQLVPGTFAIVWGLQLSEGTTPPGALYSGDHWLGYWQDADGREIKVYANGQECPLSHVSPNQINFILPKGLPIGEEVSIVVLRGDKLSNVFWVTLQAVAPAFFQCGERPCIFSTATGMLVTQENPAIRGEICVAYGQGFGPTVADPPAGYPYPAGLSPLVETLSVKVNQVSTEVVYAGGSWGQMFQQLNFVVPYFSLPGDTGGDGDPAAGGPYQTRFVVSVSGTEMSFDLPIE